MKAKKITSYADYRKFIFFVFWIMLLSGCGYTTRSAITTYRTIYVEPFKNKITYTDEYAEQRKVLDYFPLLEVKITTATVDRYLFDGNLKVVKEENADVVLKGELLGYDREVLRYDDNNNPLEYRINLVVSLSLWDRKENKLLWQESRFIGDTSYFTSGSLAKSETAAVNDAVTDLARRIVERTVEQW
ncbi:MAG: LPS assembly lipoprotein LptE [Candidatus Omnitrophota bacterium]